MVAKDVVSNEAVQAFLGDTQLTDADLVNRAQTFAANSQFKGKLTAYSKKNIVLTIDSLRLDDVEMIRGEIAKDKTHFEIVDTTVGNGEVVATLDVMPNGDNTDFVFASPAQQLNLKGSFDFDIDSLDADNIAYMVSVLATHPDFSVALRGDVDIEKTDAAVIEAPASFQTIDELVGGFRDILGTQADAGMMLEDDAMMQ